MDKDTINLLKSYRENWARVYTELKNWNGKLIYTVYFYANFSQWNRNGNVYQRTLYSLWMPQLSFQDGLAITKRSGAQWTSSSCPAALNDGIALGSPDVAHLGPVAEVPAIRRLVAPAHVTWVLPQQLHFPLCGACVPQSISQVLPWTSVRFYGLQKTKPEPTSWYRR